MKSDDSDAFVDATALKSNGISDDSDALIADPQDEMRFRDDGIFNSLFCK